jgi:hypothetical protein
LQAGGVIRVQEMDEFGSREIESRMGELAWRVDWIYYVPAFHFSILYQNFS